MKWLLLGTAAAVQLGLSVSASAQVPEQCINLIGPMRDSCVARIKRAQKSEVASGKLGAFAKTDAKLVNDSIAAADAKIAQNDFAGAAAVYDAAIAQAPTGPVAHHLYAHLATVLRRQAVTAYNSAPKPVYPPPGSPNQAIRDANASNAKLIADRRSNATSMLHKALDAAVKAATLADAQKDRTADAAIGAELREDASLLYKINQAEVLATARPSIELETTWLRKWLKDAKPTDAALVADYGIATAAALIARDPAAGWAFADEILAKTGDNVDGAILYGELAVALKGSASAAYRAKATAAVAAATGRTTDAAQQARLKQVAADLAKTN